MSIYDRLAQTLHPADLREEATSYYSTPEKELDPKLFTGREVLRPNIRSGVLSTLYGFWRSRYNDPEAWSTVFLAGSGVSYQWSAARSPGDLDCLIEVDWVTFRRLNDDYEDLGDEELGTLLNHEMQQQLWPTTANWHGYETTFYINVGRLADLHPYAAYNVTSNSWLVSPNPHATAPKKALWDHLIQQDLDLAKDIIASYNKAYSEVEGTTNPGLRLNAEITLRTAAAKGAALFDDIHSARKRAFAPGGEGFDDFNEARYKTAKAHGIMAAFREMKEELQEAQLLNDKGTYGVDLPNARDVLVRAAVARRYRG